MKVNLKEKLEELRKNVTELFEVSLQGFKRMEMLKNVLVKEGQKPFIFNIKFYMHVNSPA